MPCGGECVDLRTSVEHCGECGFACPAGGTCEGGVCSVGCQGGLDLCGQNCVDVQSDQANCGACGVVCAPSESCVEGVCVADCPEGLSPCPEGCLNLEADPENCGACGVACDPDFICLEGACHAPCSPGETRCGVACVDIDTDPQHCGACDAACAPGLACVDRECVCGSPATCGLCVQDLGSTVPQTISGDTTQAFHDYVPGCIISAGREVAYSFTAPADGTYDVEFTTGFLATLVVMDAGCAESTCEFVFGPGPKVKLDLVQGETVIVVVDGVYGETGTYSITISQAVPPVCPTADLGSPGLPFFYSGTTLGAGDALSPSCAAGAANDASFLFTAPADGYYEFFAGGTLNTAIVVLDGGCGGPELGCNDDFFTGTSSRVFVPLSQGQTVLVGVDGVNGHQGDFTLGIFDALAPVCPTFDLGAAVPQAVTGTNYVGNAMTGDAVTASCNAGAQAPDVSYTFTAPADGLYRFDTRGSSLDTALVLLDGGCSGPELGCNDDYGWQTTSRVTAQLAAGQTVVAVVEGKEGMHGDFSLEITEAPPPVCPTGDLGSTVPQSVSGTTLGAGDALSPSCNTLPTADASYTFTAPADGAYAFHTDGSALDTVIHLREGGCAGPEIACDDDNMLGDQSFVLAHLVAGQTVLVSVEGFAGQEGDFTLHVESFTPPQCPKADLGSVVPQAVQGDTSTEIYDLLEPSCASPGSPEMTYGFTAPADGIYTFDTTGSSYYSVIHIYDGCGGAELGCAFHNGEGIYHGKVAVSLVAGQQVLVVVDGQGLWSGPYVLSIY